MTTTKRKSAVTVTTVNPILVLIVPTATVRVLSAKTNPVMTKHVTKKLVMTNPETTKHVTSMKNLATVPKNATQNVTPNTNIKKVKIVFLLVITD